MPVFFNRLATALVFLLVTLQVNGATKPPAEQTESLYDIEVVIFERFGQGGDEHWPVEPGEPNRSLAIGNLSNSQALGDGILLKNEEQQFRATVYTLKKKGALIHAHLRWRQDVKGRNSNTWYLIGNQRLKGLLRISKGRYLHIDTDLLLQQPGNEQTYRIQLHRRMRSAEVHYLDHPKIGLIVRADRFEVETEENLEPPAETPVVPSSTSPISEPTESPDAGSTPRALPDPT